MLSNQWLTPEEVAQLEKCTPTTIRRWCREDFIWPCRMERGRWLIGGAYAVSLDTLRVRLANKPPKVKHAAPGRPKGSKNKNPYPKGVKRPRKKKRQSSLA